MAHPSEAHLAPYAIRSDRAGGRAHVEPDDPLRSPFELDRHRIIESTTFRRLEGKTQVFLATAHDHFRTRMTHTLEAAQIARLLAIRLRANEQLAEAITLAHDLGHPPFGHAGEAALNEAIADQGGFNHNAHSVRVVEYLEHPFPAFRGLNLTAETTAGLATHVTRYDRTEPIAHTAKDIRTRPSVEAQIASVADRIAYVCHDLEDAIGAGFMNLEDLADVVLWREAFVGATGRGLQPARTSGIPIHAVRRGVLDTLLNRVLVDVIAASHLRLASVDSVNAVRNAAEPLVAPSVEVAVQLTQLEEFLVRHLYRQPDVVNTDAQGRRMVLSLFAAYRKEPHALPTHFAARIPDQGAERVICDYIAGMTDRFCRALHERGIEHDVSD